MCVCGYLLRVWLSTCVMVCMYDLAGVWVCVCVFKMSRFFHMSYLVPSFHIVETLK